MITVDTNIIAHLLYPFTDNPAIESLQRKDSYWVAPPLWQSEFRNVTALYLRAGYITFEEAIEAMDRAERLMNGFDMSVRSEHVLDLVNQTKCSAYDCEFVSLAIELETPLITYDKQVMKYFPHVAITPEAFLSQL